MARILAPVTSHRLGPLTAWVIGCLILPLLTIQSKRSVGGSNVDDFLYSWTTLGLGSPLQPRGWVEAVLQTGYISPLVPALTSLMPTSETPYRSSVVQVLFLSLLFWSIRAIAIHTGEAHPTLWALTASVFPSMMAWVAMFHFAVASSALLAACVWAFLASEGLTRWRPTMLFGLALGALSLSRSVALVYVGALAVVVAWQLLRHWQGFRTVRGLGLAGVVALVVAGPWWLVSGPGALRYLLTAGYDNDSGFAADLSLLDRLTNRVRFTLAEWDWPVVATVALLLALWVISAAYERWRPAPPVSNGRGTPDARWMLLVLSVVGVAMLASSSNMGTGFSLPFAPLLVLGVAGGSIGLRRRWSPRLALALPASLGAVTVFLSALSTHLVSADTLSLSSSWHAGLHHAGWTEGDEGPEDVHKFVLSALDGNDALVVRDDALLNLEGLRFYSTVGSGLTGVGAAPYGDSTWLPSASDLDDLIVISGRSPLNYHGFDRDRMAAHLGEIDYWMACEITLGPDNVVELWAPSGTQLPCPDVSSPRTQ